MDESVLFSMYSRHSVNMKYNVLSTDRNLCLFRNFRNSRCHFKSTSFRFILWQYFLYQTPSTDIDEMNRDTPHVWPRAVKLAGWRFILTSRLV